MSMGKKVTSFADEQNPISSVDENQPFVRLINVNKVYDKNVHAVYDFNLDIKKREFIAFVGPSGCGKSTTLRMIAGLEDITSGEFYIGDTLANNLPSKDRDIAMVFQNYALYPNMTVFKNMAFSLSVRHYPKEEIKERVIEAAKILELEDYLDRKPKALSGGQRQRVALGRAIVRNAQLFLMDEPLSNLDAKLRVQMRSEIIKLHKRLNTTTIYVTHDQTEAMTMADRIVVMKAGHIQQVGTPLEIYRHPANRFVASFIGSPAMNFAKANYSKGVLSFLDGNKIKLSPEIVKQHDAFYKQHAVDLNNEIAELKEQSEEIISTSYHYSQLLEKSEAINNELANATDERIKEKLNKELAVIEERKNHFIKENKELKKNGKKIQELSSEIEKVHAINKGEPHDIVFGIRPEFIKRIETKTDTSLDTKVKLSELLGNEYFVHFDFGGKDFLSKIESEDIIKENDKIILQMKLNKSHLFDEYSGKAITK